MKAEGKPIEDIDHALGVRVAIVGAVRRALVDHGLVNGVRCLVGEDARGKARDALLDLGIEKIMACCLP